MYRISNLRALAKVIKDRKPVVVGRSGQWHIQEGSWNAFKRHFQGSDAVGLRLAERLIPELDAIEAFPVRFSEQSEALASQSIDFQGYLEVAIALYELVSKSENSSVLKMRQRLQDRTIALMYRLEGANGGLDAQAWNQPLFQTLVERAREWKTEQTAFYGEELDKLDSQRLEQAARYPAFVALLDHSGDLRNSFFEWVIRDRMDVDAFVQYPALRERVAQSYLGSRIGRFGGHLLRIRKLAGHGDAALLRKVVTLPFEGREVNVLDPQRAVTFRGNYRMTIQQVFGVFASKMERVGDLEFLKEGITNWNAHVLGWWNADAKTYEQIDVDQPGWWKQLPVLEELSLKDAQRRYGREVNGQDWILSANATRTTRTLDPDASHAFLEVVIPTERGRYAVYAMGKFATTYSGSLFQSLQLFTATLHATVAYPDENIFYTHRQRDRHSFVVTPAHGFEFMDSIKNDIVDSRGGSFTYQIESENCAKWIQDKLEAHFGTERVPDMFRIAMLETEPPGPTKKMFELMRKLPHDWHSPVLSVLHYIIGAWRGIWVEVDGEQVWRSVTTTQFWEDKVTYLPAMLHTQRTEGNLAKSTIIARTRNTGLSRWSETRSGHRSLKLTSLNRGVQVAEDQLLSLIQSLANSFQERLSALPEKCARAFQGALITKS